MVVIIEAEDLPATGDWKVVNDPDASGGQYIAWEGLAEEQNNGSADDGDIISTTIDITTPGTYTFKLLMRQPSGVDSDRPQRPLLRRREVEPRRRVLGVQRHLHQGR